MRIDDLKLIFTKIKPRSILRIKKILSCTLIILILFIPIRFIFFKPKEIKAADIYLGFNEGYGTTVNDNNQNVSAGTISGAIWKTDDLCKNDQCLYFDGDQDYISFTDDSDLDFAAADSFTINFWFRHAPKTSGTEVFINKLEDVGTDGGYEIQMESDGDITCQIEDDDADTAIDDAITSTAATYDDNQWHFVSCVKSAATSLTLYIDGNQVAQDTSLDGSSTLANDDTFYIGIDGDGVSNDYAGFIDEVKVYRSARTTAEIKADYLGETFSRGTAASFSPNDSWLSNGLVGYWKMDEATANSCGTDDSCDSSGNGANGAWVNNTTFTPGKYGNGTLFDGINDSIVIPDDNNFSVTTTNQLTVSAWVKPAVVNTSQRFVNKTGVTGGYEWTLQIASDGTITGGLHNTAGSDYLYVSTLSTLTAGNWYLATFTANAITNTVDLYLNGVLVGTSTTTSGSIANGTESVRFGEDGNGNNDFNGSLDEVRIYNRALTPAEVQKLYNWAPGPVGYWPMDENTGSSITSGSISVRIASSSDDAEEDVSDGSISLTSSDLEMVIEEFDGEQQVGMRFPVINVPQGAAISNAYIQFDVDETNSTATTLTFYGEDIDDAPTFTTSGSNITNRTKTSSSVSWDVPSWPTADVHGADQKTPDLSTIVQEIVDRGSWSSGNDMAFIVSGTGSGTRIAESVDGDASNAPLLTFDYTSGTQGYAYDHSGNNNDTSLMNSPAWTTGRYGSALSFAGSDQHLTRADDPDFDFADDADMTLTAWFKHTTASAQEVILSKYNEAGYKIIMESDGDITCALDYDAIWTPTDSVTSTAATYDDGNWHYATCVKIGASSLSLYIDGVLITTNPSITATNTLTNSDPLYIGINADGTSNDFIGSLDDVKIYNYARTPKQIIEDMNAGHPAPGSPVNSAYIKYRFDEGYGSSANNSGFGGSSLNGSITSGTWTDSGKFGKALTFTASTTVTATITDPGYTNTVSLWVYPTTSVASKTLVTSSKLTTDSSSRPIYGGCTGTTLSLSIWTHIVAVSNGSGSCAIYQNGNLTASSTTGVTFGTSLAIGATSFTGNVDEFIFYNSALSSDQVKLLYNQSSASVMGALSTDYASNYAPSWSSTNQYCPPGQGSVCTPPVAHWKLDENTGTATNDISGNSNTGTLNSFPSNPWRPGQLGSSLEFDASDDNITAGSGTSIDNVFTGGGTYVAWIKANSFGEGGTSGRILDKGGSLSNTGPAFYLCGSGSGCTSTIAFFHGDSDINGSIWRSSDNAIALNDWYHVAVVFNKDSISNEPVFYVNGVLQTTTNVVTADGSFDDDNAQTQYIGNRLGTDRTFDGILDDVKIYNYARTQTQIAWDFNRGGPVGWWKFDESSWTNNCSTDTVFDSSVHANHGDSCPNTTGQTTPETGKFNNAIHFDDSDDYISIPDDTSLDLTNNLSISAWVKTDADEADNVIVSKGTSYEMGIDGSGNVYWYNGSVTPDDGSAKVTSGAWHHVVITNDDTTTTYYVDGIQTGTDSAGIGADNATALRIGYDGTNYFDGLIDDVRIYNYVLTSQQIKTTMNEGVLRFGP